MEAEKLHVHKTPTTAGGLQKTMLGVFAVIVIGLIVWAILYLKDFVGV